MLTTIIANTSKHTGEMSNALSPVADPTASTESKTLDVTSLAVIRMSQRNVDSFSVTSQDANPPIKDSQEKTILKDTCDSIPTWLKNHQGDPRYLLGPRTENYVRIEPHVRIELLQYHVIIEPLVPTYHLETTMTQEVLKNLIREIRAMNWADRCSLKWRLYNSGHPYGGCRFPEPSRLLSITGVQPRKLRVKDWQNAHGKVGIIGSLFHLRS